MAVIDVSAIEGFESMTAEQKVDALTKFEIPEAVDMSKYVSKEVFDKKASEAAGLSKQLKDKMSEDERSAAEKAENEKKILAELEQLRKDKTIATYTSQYLSMGYTKELAEDTAKAMADGDMDKVFANGVKHRDAMEKEIKEKLMNGTPKPSGAGGSGDNKADSAIEKAKELAKAKNGGGKQYEDIMKNYRK